MVAVEGLNGCDVLGAGMEMMTLLQMCPGSTIGNLPNGGTADAELRTDGRMAEVGCLQKGLYFTDLFLCKNVSPTTPISEICRSWNVFPMIACNNLGKHLLGYFKLTSYVAAIRPRSYQVKNLYNIAFRQFSRTRRAAYIASVQSVRVSVGNIFRTRGPFKIRRSIVSFDAVDVVGVMPLRRRWSFKRIKHQSMHDNMLLLGARLRWGDGKVAAPFKPLLQNQSGLRSRSRRVPPYAAKIADRVVAFPTDNWFPKFHVAENST